jgi:hypothetical protein
VPFAFLGADRAALLQEWTTSGMNVAECSVTTTVPTRALFGAKE